MRLDGKGWLISLAQCSGRGADKVAKKRVRPGRARLELRMELTPDHPRMVGDLNDFDQLTIRGDTRDLQARCLQRRPILIVELPAVSMPLVNNRLVIGTCRPAP